jgi:hypothetical protein
MPIPATAKVAMSRRTRGIMSAPADSRMGLV